MGGNPFKGITDAIDVSKAFEKPKDKDSGPSAPLKRELDAQKSAALREKRATAKRGALTINLGGPDDNSGTTRGGLSIG